LVFSEWWTTSKFCFGGNFVFTWSLPDTFLQVLQARARLAAMDQCQIWRERMAETTSNQ
jgi:hypothetical protein